MTEYRERVFYNHVIDRAAMSELIGNLVTHHGHAPTAAVLDHIKALGFECSTLTGISLGIDDLLVAYSKALLVQDAEHQARASERGYRCGAVQAVEKLRQITETWHTTSEFLKREMSLGFNLIEPLNPVHMMSFSGSRGSTSQVHQLAGMRGLMADAQGRLIDLPIQSNLREGLSLAEYIVSCYGARKGVVDTAIRTADAGYLTRRLVLVAQHLVVRQMDCGTLRGVHLRSVEGEQGDRFVSYQDRLLGRVLARSVYAFGRCIAVRNQDVGTDLADRLMGYGCERLLVRSPLVCRGMRWVCQLCYGWGANYGRLVRLGEAIGVIAGQSIGEPGTQLTLRTFHTGGVFTGDIANHVRAPLTGVARFEPSTCEPTRNRHGRPAWKCIQDLTVRIESGDRSQSLTIPRSSLLLITDGQYVESQQVVAEIRAAKTPFKEGVQRHVCCNLQGQVLYESTLGPLRRPLCGLKAKTSGSRHDGFAASNAGHVWVLSGQLLNYTPMLSVVEHLDSIGADLSTEADGHGLLHDRQLVVPHPPCPRGATMVAPKEWLLWEWAQEHRESRPPSPAKYSHTGTTVCVGSEHAACLGELHSLALTLSDQFRAPICGVDGISPPSDNRGLVQPCRGSSSSDQHSGRHTARGGVLSILPDRLNPSTGMASLTLRAIGAIGRRSTLIPRPAGLANNTNHMLPPVCIKRRSALVWRVMCEGNKTAYGVIGLNPCDGIAAVRTLVCFIMHTHWLPWLGQLLSSGVILERQRAVNEPGKMIAVSQSEALFRLGQCYLVVPGVRMYAYCNEVIDEQEALLALLYEQLRTSDIVQGLPKAERLLEARPSSQMDLKLQAHFAAWMHCLSYLSQPHVLSAHKSLEETQAGLVDRVQAVYLSQGVCIADRHLEVVVRQIGSSVAFLQSRCYGQYRSSFLPGELVELSRARRISSVFSTLVEYKPVLLGMTKASLGSDSFIASASFERAARTLSRAAVQGKADWIRGLQANVLFGGTIPAGTACGQIGPAEVGTLASFKQDEERGMCFTHQSNRRLHACLGEETDAWSAPTVVYHPLRESIAQQRHKDKARITKMYEEESLDAQAVLGKTTEGGGSRSKNDTPNPSRAAKRCRARNRTSRQGAIRGPRA